MDGPNVNWKAEELFEEENNSLASAMLSLGSCGLHVLHGAYSTGRTGTNWDLDKSLKNCFGKFKKAPARRADYLFANNLHETHKGWDT